VEPKRENGQIITLEADITDEKTKKLEKLISIVYKKIISLDFPDIGKYSKDLKGEKEFEEDLLWGRI